MKTNIKRMAAAWLPAFLMVVLSSFYSGRGGDGFEIYINQQLVVQQYPATAKQVKQVALEQGQYAAGQLRIRFSHCGRPGTDRQLILKDGQNKVLQQWRFANAGKGEDGFMTCAVKAIMDAQKSKGNELRLYYVARELTIEKLLASFTAGRVAAP